MTLEEFKKDFDEKLAAMTDEEIIAEFEALGCNVVIEKPKIFYRVCNPTTEQGLWYDFKGDFTGLIHDRFDFCVNSKLEMPFDEELVGWLSAVESLDDLWKWFSREDVTKLQEQGWYIFEYEATEYKFYDKSQHMVIKQDSSVLITKIDYLKAY